MGREEHSRIICLNLGNVRLVVGDLALYTLRTIMFSIPRNGASYVSVGKALTGRIKYTTLDGSGT